MKKLIFTFFLCLLAAVQSAWGDFTYTYAGQTLTYWVLSSTDKTVEVTPPNDVSGAVKIPATVTDGGTTYSVTSIGGWVFSGCSGLTSVTIPASVTSIGNDAFSGCSGLTSVTIPASVTSIGNYAFNGCSGLTGVTIPASVTSIEDCVFSGCSGLTGVTIPASVTSIGDCAFRGCSGLTGVTISASVTSIGDKAFSGCSGLTEIDVSASNTKYQSIDGILYSKTGDILVCYPGGKKGSVTISASVTSIGESAFDGCSGLTGVTIPNSVTSIGDWAFSGCSGLKRLICYALTPPSLGGSGVFYNVGTDVSVIVCQSAVDAYKTANRWKNFSNYTSVGTPTITLAAANKETCDDASLELPMITIDYHVEVDTARTLQYAVNKGAYSAFNPNTFSLSKLGGTTLTIKCAANNVCGTAVDSMMLKVGRTYNVVLDSTVCDSVLWNGKSYTESGVYTFNGVTATGCDSIVTMNLKVNKSVRVAIDSTVCDSALWNGKSCYQSGTYTFNGVTATDCDSIVTMNLRVNKSVRVAIDSTVCDSVFWHGKSCYQSGTYTFNGVTATGCDSIVTMNLRVNKSVRVAIDSTVCDSVLWNGKSCYQSGTYTFNGVTATGCDSIVTMNLKVNKSVRVAIDSTVCDSVLWHGKSCYQSGTYTFNGVTATGCDSIVTMNLKVNKSVRVAIDSMVNKGIVWNKMACDTTGDYVYNGVTATGCDSIVTLHLTVKPAIPSAVSVLTSEEGAAFVVTAMPNPARANENFVVMVKGLGSDELSGVSLMVYAENGRLVYGAKGVSAANAVSLPCGNYVAVVTTAGGRRTQCKVLVRP
jgi:hypothetical protein